MSHTYVALVIVEYNAILLYIPMTTVTSFESLYKKCGNPVNVTLFSVNHINLEFLCARLELFFCFYLCCLHLTDLGWSSRVLT